MEITESLYYDILDYTRCEFNSIVYGHVNFTYTDIAHDIIADPKFSVEWKKLVKKHLFSHLKDKLASPIELDKADFTYNEPKYPCQGCHEEFHTDRFQSSYALCNKCYRDKNKDRINANTRNWRKKHPDKVKQSNRDQREKRKEENRRYMKQYRERNRTSLSNYGKEYKERYKEKIKKSRREYYLKNKK